MKLEERFPLDRLVALSLGSSLLLPVILVGLVLFNALGHAPTRPAGVALLFAGSVALPTALALVATFAARNAIRRGLMDGRWPASEQTNQYNRLLSKAWRWPVGIVLLAAIALPFMSLLRLPSHARSYPWGGFIYFLIAPVWARSELLKLLTPFREPGEKGWLHEMKPIHSAHWGQSEDSLQPR